MKATFCKLQFVFRHENYFCYAFVLNQKWSFKYFYRWRYFLLLHSYERQMISSVNLTSFLLVYYSITEYTYERTFSE